MRVILDLREGDQVRARRLRLEPNLQGKVLEQVGMSRLFPNLCSTSLCAWELGDPTSGGDAS